MVAVERGGSLLSNAVERRVVVETEVASVDDVVGSCVACEFVQRSKVACPVASVSFPPSRLHYMLTSHVGDTENSGATSLHHATLVREKWRRSGDGARCLSGSAVGDVGLAV